MKSDLLSIVCCAVFLFALTILTSSCGSEPSYSAGYDSGYEDGYYEGANDASEAYNDGYNEGLSELERYKEEHLIVPYFVDELISSGRYQVVRDMLNTDLFYPSAILGEYVGDEKTKVLHTGDCEALNNISMDRYVLFVDNAKNAIENGYEAHSCVDTSFLDDPFEND